MPCAPQCIVMLAELCHQFYHNKVYASGDRHVGKGGNGGKLQAEGVVLPS